ncbi:hypothetical protein RvY_02306 [Ramazzottius varieornatus]|uniref:DDE Tnp4 domain-containing protein n=2 Tax=Ramazzottius varieornatus TaxID=947166 RepID=A0A1D1UJB3_RAMVA|nr:hypothetical protein RvY_02306 [Ramazzottius varieornatus]
MPRLVNRKELVRSVDVKILTDLVLHDVLDSSSDEEDEMLCETDGSSSEDDEEIKIAVVRYFATQSRHLSARVNSPKTKELAYLIFQSDELTFKRNARMTRQAFFAVVDKIGSHIVFRNKSHHEQAPVPDQLMVALSRFGFDGSASSLWTAGSRLGIGEGTVSLYTERVMYALLSLEKTVVTWPNTSERATIKARIEKNQGFPHCLGYVDGSLIGLQEAPSMCGEDYYTRKGSYAINAMIVCDDLKRICHVFAGFPGCSHDHRVFMYSKLALNPFKYFSGHEYLLADSAYPVSDIIVPTFKKPLANSHENTALNTAHSQARVIVEQTIGMLKGRFQSLKALRLRIKNKKDHEFAVYWIRTCCMLHNMLLDDEYDEEWTVEDDGDDGPIPNPNQQAVATERGSTKRERIKQYVLKWQ